MSIHYRCRHCGTNIGTLEQKSLDSSRLGFDELDTSERKEMIIYDNEGNLQVNAICEDCHEALQRNPDFYENDTFIQ
ncbi:MAG: anti-sigma-F factor Fin family protein [Bacillaceae bacterium]|nr:anti-sigma-F factor Fin family protein [Bacillaceae bacterium]